MNDNDHRDHVRADGAPDGAPDVGAYLTPKEIAELLKMSESTVRKLLVQRKLCAFIRVGRAIRVRVEVFRAWQAQRDRDYQLSPGVLRDRPVKLGRGSR